MNIIGYDTNHVLEPIHQYTLEENISMLKEKLHCIEYNADDFEIDELIKKIIVNNPNLNYIQILNKVYKIIGYITSIYPSNFNSQRSHIYTSLDLLSKDKDADRRVFTGAYNGYIKEAGFADFNNIFSNQEKNIISPISKRIINKFKDKQIPISLAEYPDFIKYIGYIKCNFDFDIILAFDIAQDCKIFNDGLLKGQYDLIISEIIYAYERNLDLPPFLKACTGQKVDTLEEYKNKKNGKKIKKTYPDYFDDIIIKPNKNNR